jgi:hypothetical protein
MNNPLKMNLLINTKPKMKKDLIPKEVSNTIIANFHKRQHRTNSLALGMTEHIFPNCIGIENAITKEDLFRMIFKQTYTGSDTHWLWWEFTKKAMLKIRQSAHCFVIWQKDGPTYKYFVPCNREEAAIYKDGLTKMEKRIGFMKRKIDKFVDNGDWKYPKRWIEVSKQQELENE